MPPVGGRALQLLERQWELERQLLDEDDVQQAVAEDTVEMLAAVTKLSAQHVAEWFAQRQREHAQDEVAAQSLRGFSAQARAFARLAAA